MPSGPEPDQVAGPAGGRPLTAAVILAGGSGRRLGGVDKPALTVAGSTLLDRALTAVGDVRTVVVGPHRTLPPGVRSAREDPPGSGPAAAVVAGLAALDREIGSDGASCGPYGLIAVLAADLPGVTTGTVARLVSALTIGSGVLLLDAAGRRQWLLGVWEAGPLRAAAAHRDWAGGRLSDLLGPLVTAEIPAAGDEAADIDLPADLARWAAGPGGP